MDSVLPILRDYGTLLLVGQYPNGPLGGLAITLVLSVLGLSLAFPLGVAIALARISPFGWLRMPAAAVIYMVRGVPLLMFIFWVYFFVPVLTGRTVSGFTTMVITLVIYQAAYLAEIVRAGIQGLPDGQTEAARAVGLSYTQTMLKVVLPQALYNMVPALVSQFVSTIKETSLGYVISVNEVTFAANQINSSLMTQPFQVYFILAAIYFCLCFSLTRLARFLERRIAARRESPFQLATSAALVTARTTTPNQAA
ncbi:polar amino acid transport system permease protein [Variovorax boronicumulans]|uniref:amino acid ABC transporter permease n=1 Tax=Variovorax boronicumulans TaxID=436515 RepID=UPI002786D5FD|nr:amino acid ABC transporter permease [Variovorax boronicumulans]MDP9994011.1 polar amino acid transport system permease protein [Variovorax boronicumulans]MDQ0005126.1 polar amino acid transport system permease protein [Variovorax boronicumulans]